MGDGIRIVVADDHPIVRRGVVQVLAAEPGFEVVAEAGDGEAALAEIERLRPDVAVLDVDMPKLDGLAVAREVFRRGSEVSVVFLTIHTGEDIFNEAIDLGAYGYVLKESAVVDVVSAVRAAAAKTPYVTPSLTPYLLRRGARRDALARGTPGLGDLTRSERRILKLIAEEKTSREIADRLFISPRTVENHRTNICQKLGLQGSHALVKFALKHKSELL
jgi:DNA-binding NarL/FixJ family response regulator